MSDAVKLPPPAAGGGTSEAKRGPAKNVGPTAAGPSCRGKNSAGTTSADPDPGVPLAEIDSGPMLNTEYVPGTIVRSALELWFADRTVVVPPLATASLKNTLPVPSDFIASQYTVPATTGIDRPVAE